MSTGPETVPPGRSSAGPTSWETVAPPLATSRMAHFVCGNSLAMNAAISSLVATIVPCVKPKRFGKRRAATDRKCSTQLPARPLHLELDLVRYEIPSCYGCEKKKRQFP